MAPKKVQPWSAGAWALVHKQHGVVARAQLIDLGMGPAAIRHRLATGRLRPLLRGVYAVGRRDVGTQGRRMAAVLACGPHAFLSHRSAAALWGIRREPGEPIEVVVPDHVCRRRPGIRVHRRAGLMESGTRTVDGIPVTDPVSTLVDLAMCTSNAELEEAVNEADHRNLIDPEALRAAIDSIPERPGVGRLRRLLDPHTFVVTDSRLEQRFLPLARSVGLPLPQTQVWLNGTRVDFFWPDLGLIVEADSLRYHRTAAKQTADLRRDQAHTAAGLSTLRFTHWEVFHEPNHVRETLATTFRWIAARPTYR
jgi:hypothetical protein